MATLQVRNLPEHIYERLVRDAELEHRSLTQQAVATLAKGLNLEIDPRERRRRAIEEIKRLDLRGGRKMPNIVKMIREDRNR